MLEILKTTINAILKISQAFPGTKLTKGVSIDSVSLDWVRFNAAGEETLVPLSDTSQLPGNTSALLQLCYKIGSGEVRIMATLVVDGHRNITLEGTIIPSSVIFPDDLEDGTTTKEFNRRIDDVTQFLCSIIVTNLNAMTKRDGGGPPSSGGVLPEAPDGPPGSAG